MNGKWYLAKVINGIGGGFSTGNRVFARLALDDDLVEIIHGQTKLCCQMDAHPAQFYIQWEWAIDVLGNKVDMIPCYNQEQLDKQWIQYFESRDKCAFMER
jgi:hypothetical protein